MEERNVKLTNIRCIGRFEQIATGKKCNIHQGRNMQRSTDDNYFYYYRGSRELVNLRDWKRIDNLINVRCSVL